MIKPKIIISDNDYDGLHSMLEKEVYAPSHDLLIDELERAKIVDKANASWKCLDWPFYWTRNRVAAR